MVSHKICNKCHRKKPASEFYANAYSKNGLQAWCKVCQNADTARRKNAQGEKKPDPDAELLKDIDRLY